MFGLLYEVAVLGVGAGLARTAEVDLPAGASLPEEEAVHRPCVLCSTLV